VFVDKAKSRCCRVTANSEARCVKTFDACISWGGRWWRWFWGLRLSTEPSPRRCWYATWPGYSTCSLS